MVAMSEHTVGQISSHRSQRTVVALVLLLILGGQAARAHARPAASKRAVAAAHPGKIRLGRNGKKPRRAEEEGTAAFKHSKSVSYIAKTYRPEPRQRVLALRDPELRYGRRIASSWASKKNLPAIFRNRTASIQQAMAEARAASEDANRRLADIESRLSRLDSEIAGMRTAAEKEAVAEEERIKTATADEMKKVVESAEQEIRRRSKNARRELRAYAANLVVSLAEKQIKVDAATDQALVHRFAKRLASDGDSPRDAR